MTGFIALTGQLWKLHVGTFIVVCCFLGTVALIGAIKDIEPTVFLVSFGGLLAIGASAFAWVLWSVRCPSCHTRVIWLFARRRPFGDFLTLTTAPQCPLCRYPESAMNEMSEQPGV